jgi:hypothetical protein
MLSIDALREVARRLSSLPTVIAVGLLVIGLGLGLDAYVHLASPADHAAGFGPLEHAAHAVVVVGMALTLAGIVADGVRRTPTGALGPKAGR